MRLLSASTSHRALLPLFVALLATPFSSHTVADDAKLQPAVIAFRFEVSRLLDSKVGVELTEKMIVGGNAPAPGPDMADMQNPQVVLAMAKKIKTVSGQIALPKEFGPQGITQTNFFVVVNFETAEAAATEYEALPQFQVVKIEGADFKQIGGQGGVPAVLARLNGKSIDIGTRAYMLSGQRSFATPAVIKAYQALPKAPMRIVLDFDANKDYVKQLVDMMMQDADPVSAEMIRMLRQISVLAIHINPEGDEMVGVTSTSHNVDEADTIKTKVTAVLGLAKANLKEIPSPAGKKLAASIIENTTVTQAGLVTQLKIKRPADYEAQLKQIMAEAQQQAKAMQGLNNLKQVALSVHNYHDAYGRFPFEDTQKGELHEGLSWRVAVLPFVEQQALYDKFDRKSAWDSPKNKPHEDVTVATFKAGETGQVVWVRPEKPPIGFRDVLDGTSNTIMCIENPKATGAWTKRNPITIDDAIKIIKGQPAESPIRAAMYDGSVRHISPSIDEAVLRNLLDPKDGNAVPANF